MIEQTTLQNTKAETLNQLIITKQSSPATPLKTPVETGAKISKKNISKQSSTVPKEPENIKMVSLEPSRPITDAVTTKQKGMDEALKINKTQSETEIEDVSLKTIMFINKTQRSISERVDDSADTGEYVDELPEDREKSSE